MDATLVEESGKVDHVKSVENRKVEDERNRREKAWTKKQGGQEGAKRQGIKFPGRP